MVDVLIIDDEATTRLLVTRRLDAAGFSCRTAATGADAIDVVRRGFRGVIVLDLQLPDIDGRRLLPKLRELGGGNPVIILTSHGSADAALDTLREGAFDFLAKEHLSDRLVSTVKRAADTMGELAPDDDTDGGEPLPGVIARSPEMRAVVLAVENAIQSQVPIMLRGESGTGKEVVARAIHELGPRGSGPFVALNCAAIPENLLEAELFGYERGAFTGAVARKRGRFELARGGTLMLDEIGEMHPLLQAKLLRVLQDGEFQRLGGTETLVADVRIISATHRDLEAEVAAGRFREDLYYRMAVFTVHLPPLRKRTGDIPVLIDHFIQQSAAREGKRIDGLDPIVRELLETYTWPGNVRELQNVVSHAVVAARGTVIAMSDLPAGLLRSMSDQRRGDGAEPARSVPVDSARLSEGEFPTLAEVERRHILDALERAEGNKARAARMLGISRMTLYRKLEELSQGET